MICRAAWALALALLLWAGPTTAQTPTWRWAQPFGDWITPLTLATTIDRWGNTYVTGSFDTLQAGSTTLLAPGYRDAFVGKLDTAGRWLWVRTLNTRYARGFKLVADTASGDVLVSGQFQDSAHFGAIRLGPYPREPRNFVARLSPAGQWRWAVSFTDEGTQSNYLPVMTFVPDGRVVFATAFAGQGQFGPFSITPQTWGRVADIVVASLDGATGAWQWVTSGGGINDDYVHQITCDQRGNLYLTAVLSGPSPRFGSLIVPIMLNTAPDVTLRLSPTGQWQWFHFYGLGESTVVLTPNRIFQAVWFEGTITLGATTLTSRGAADAVLVEFDSTGSIRSAEQIGGAGRDYVLDMKPDEGGRLVVAGKFEHEIQLGPLTVVDTAAAANDAMFLGRVAPPAVPGGPWQWEWAMGISGSRLRSNHPLGVGSGALSIGASLDAGAVSFATLPVPTPLYDCGVVANLRWGPVPAGPVATLPLLAERLTWAVAPNPAHAAGFVRLLAAPAGAVQLLDAAGRVVRTATVAPAATETHLPVAGLAPGVYLVRAGAQVRRLVLN